MGDKIKINGRADLYRDMHTNAIINNSIDLLEQAKNAKNNKLNQAARLDSLEQKVNKILELLTEKT